MASVLAFRKFPVLEVETSNTKVRRGNCVLEKEFRFLAVTQVRLIEHVPLAVFHPIPIDPRVPEKAVTTGGGDIGIHLHLTLQLFLSWKSQVKRRDASRVELSNLEIANLATILIRSNQR